MVTPAALLADNIGLTYVAASRFAARLGRLDLLPDLKQAAAEGFLAAFDIKQWDRRWKLSTFVGWEMHHKMQACARVSIDSFGPIPWDVMQNQTEHEVPITGSLQYKQKTGDSELIERVTILDDSYDRVDEILAAEQDVAALRHRLPQHMQVWVDEILAGTSGSRQKTQHRLNAIREAL